jgi:hypothetical protein
MELLFPALFTRSIFPHFFPAQFSTAQNSKLVNKSICARKYFKVKNQSWIKPTVLSQLHRLPHRKVSRKKVKEISEAQSFTLLYMKTLWL